MKFAVHGPPWTKGEVCCPWSIIICNSYVVRGKDGVKVSMELDDAAELAAVELGFSQLDMVDRTLIQWSTILLCKLASFYLMQKREQISSNQLLVQFIHNKLSLPYWCIGHNLHIQPWVMRSLLADE